MPLYDKSIQPFYTFLDTLFSIARVVGQAKFCKTRPMTRHHEKCLILGNGPSLLDTLKKNEERLCDFDLVAVNFFANSPEYITYKPNKYVLCDQAFWFDGISENDDRFDQLYKTMAKVTQWPLQLYLPYQAKKCCKIKEILTQNPNIDIIFYNKTKYEGWGQNFVYHRQWGMPRAQNVLIAALMLAIHADYAQIYLAGADNDWMHNIWVDEHNNLRKYDTHFYDINEAKAHAGFMNVPIENELCSIYLAFHGYAQVQKFAMANKKEIYNTTLLSYIDSFPKKLLQ